MTKKILLGFEVPSGKAVFILLHHLVITGMTQLSGKTTTIEALIQRSGLRAIVFKTKRGEKGFERVGRFLPLYFKERSDWQYVSSLIEATLREKMKFERSWIIRACKGTKSLQEVYQRVKDFLKKERLRALDESIFTNLQAYLELVLPSIEKLHFTDKLDIGPGVNVMDLEDLYAKPEVQALIIRSVMEYILEFERDIIVVVPECWKFLPQARGSPVKVFFERFIREGASIGNYLWLDSQDIAGVDKTPLRQVDNWILGRQKETHEVNRTIDAIPLPKAQKPKPVEIRRLTVGHFIAACGDQVRPVYVLPAGVPEDIGRKVAVGELTPAYVRDHYLKVTKEDEDLIYKEKYEKEKAERERLEGIVRAMQKKLEKAESPEAAKELRAMITGLEEEKADLHKIISKMRKDQAKINAKAEAFEKLQKALEPLIPTKINSSETQGGTKKTVNLENIELITRITHSEEILDISTKTQQGQILYCAIHDLQCKGFTEKQMSEALEERGWAIPHTSLAPQLSSNLRKLGLILKIPNTRPIKYRLPSKRKINVIID